MVASKEEMNRRTREKCAAMRKHWIELRGGACQVCGAKSETFDFHHVDPSTKKFKLFDRCRTEKSIRDEAAKCIMLCTKCHRAAHSKKSGAGALKGDCGKPRPELIPGDAIMAEAEVMRVGAMKYGDYNWSKGMEWSRFIGAALRHLYAWSGGEDLDKETGLSHLSHLACCAHILFSYQKNGLGLDDRYCRQLLSVKGTEDAGNADEGDVVAAGDEQGVVGSI